MEMLFGNSAKMPYLCFPIAFAMEEPALHWYALKVFYNKVFEMEDLLHGMGIETFLAVDKRLLKGPAHLLARKHIASLKEMGKADVRYIEEGALIYQRVPLITSLLFFRTDPDSLSAVENAIKDANDKAKGFIYRTADWKAYAVIPDAQMKTFRLVTAKGAEGLDFFSSDDFTRFREGRKVRVTGGPFKGVEGYIKRIKRDRRLLVSLEGIVAVATSFIPPELLETVQE